MYIVLRGSSFLQSKLGPTKLGPRHVVYCEGFPLEIWGQFLHGSFETQDGRYSTPGRPTLSTLVRYKSNTDVFFPFSFLSLSSVSPYIGLAHRVPATHV